MFNERKAPTYSILSKNKNKFYEKMYEFYLLSL
jgi:hypothetical protein